MPDAGKLLLLIRADGERGEWIDVYAPYMSHRARHADEQTRGLWSRLGAADQAPDAHTNVRGEAIRILFAACR